VAVSRETRAPRLYVEATLVPGRAFDLPDPQGHYLTSVLRLREGDPVLVFNGRDGEWRAALLAAGKRRWQLEPERQTQAQAPPPDLHYLFAPLKQARLDYLVQKAVEMGAGRLRPVITRFTQVARIGRARMVANAIEAAEQSGILSVPTVDEPIALSDLLDGWSTREPSRRLVFCDEGTADADPIAALDGLRGAPLAVLVGPEGGFAEDERSRLRAASFVRVLPLGPRVLRADTAAVAALALVQAAAGDWRNGPPRRAP
jgi:16S rRNA (uracil1498-N3)-methyltransferase